MRALAVGLAILGAGLATRVAHGDPAGRELCRRGAVPHGATLELDVKGADLHDVFRLIAEVAHANVVIPDDITGKVTLRLRSVPWETVACAVAAAHGLAITVDGNILVIARAAR
jgi:type II secretory pathway component HofQ